MVEAHRAPKNYGSLTEVEAEDCYQEVVEHENAKRLLGWWVKDVDVREWLNKKS